MINKALDRTKLYQKPVQDWSDEDIHVCVSGFLDQRFPTIVALNKIDLPDSDSNLDKICRKYDEVLKSYSYCQSKLVLISALSEIFLKKLHSQGFLRYVEGTDEIELAEDQPEDAVVKLKPLDEKTRGYPMP